MIDTTTIRFLPGLLALFVLTRLTHAHLSADSSPPLLLISSGSHVHAQENDHASYACLREKLPDEPFCADGLASNESPDEGVGTRLYRCGHSCSTVLLYYCPMQSCCVRYATACQLAKKGRPSNYAMQWMDTAAVQCASQRFMQRKRPRGLHSCQ